VFVITIIHYNPDGLCTKQGFVTQKVKKIVSFKWEFVLTEFQCNIFRNQFGGVFVGFFNAKYCGYCLTVDF
jgi:hypothetical protein